MHLRRRGGIRQGRLWGRRRTGSWRPSSERAPHCARSGMSSAASAPPPRCTHALKQGFPGNYKKFRRCPLGFEGRGCSHETPFLPSCTTQSCSKAPAPMYCAFNLADQGCGRVRAFGMGVQEICIRKASAAKMVSQIIVICCPPHSPP